MLNQRTFVSAVLTSSSGKKIRNFLNGTWLGEPQHVVLTDVPVRRAGRSTSDQSVTPVTAVPTAQTNPIAIDVSAASANSRRARIKSKTSNAMATVQAPIDAKVQKLIDEKAARFCQTASPTPQKPLNDRLPDERAPRLPGSREVR